MSCDIDSCHCFCCKFIFLEWHWIHCGENAVVEQFLLGSLSRGFYFCNFLSYPTHFLAPFFCGGQVVLSRQEIAMQILYLQILYPASGESGYPLSLQILQGYRNICRFFIIVCHSPCSCPSLQSCWASFPCPSCCSRCPLTSPMKRGPRDGLALSVQGCEKWIAQSI